MFPRLRHFPHNPSDFYTIVKALPEKTFYVVIDEIQKVPRLLSEARFF